VGAHGEGGDPDGGDRVARLIERKKRARHRRRLRLVASVVVASLLVVATAVVLADRIASWGRESSGGSESPDHSGVAALETNTPTPYPSPSATPSESPAGTPAEPSPPPAEPSPTPRPRFVVDRALADVRGLERCGVRTAGSAAEKRGAEYIVKRLRAAGADCSVSTFSLPNGKTSRYVVARFPGSTPQTIILGAHMDAKAPSPGANDNGSGCAVLLELARCLMRGQVFPGVKLVFFGSEEMIDADADHHHFGSRSYVSRMSDSARRETVGMISVDMVGVGPDFVVRSMGRGPRSMVNALLRRARTSGVRMSYLRDPGASGWSDHEAFELAGIPSAWIEWRDDPVYHTAADTHGHIVAAKVRTTGSFLLGFLRDLRRADLERLRR